MKDIKDMSADLALQSNTLKAVCSVFFDTFASGSEKNIIKTISAQPETFSYLAYAISDYVDRITKISEDLENALYK